MFVRLGLEDDTPKLRRGPTSARRVLWVLLSLHLLIVVLSYFTLRNDMNGSVAAADELLLGVTMLTSPLAVAGPLVSLYVACAKGVAKYWLNVAAEICIGIAHGLLLFPLIQ